MLYNFDSVEQFAARAAAVPDRHRRPEADSWHGGISYQDAVNLAQTGDDSLVAQAEKLLDQLEASIEVHAYTVRRDVCGARVSVPDYLTGAPTSMRRRVKTVSDLSLITVYVSTTCSGTLDAETMLKRGIAILALLMKLERIRPVTLVLLAETHGATDGACIQAIRVESQPINLSTACFALAHVGFARHLTYSLARELEQFNGAWPRQLKELGAEGYTAWLREHVGMQPQDLYIARAASTDELLSDPVAWVNQQVQNTQGAKLMTTTTLKVELPLGHIVATPGALDAFVQAQTSPMEYLRRHASGDWGELDAHDKAANSQALIHGERIFSAYRLPDGVKVWLITEADRSATTFLLPEEY